MFRVGGGGRCLFFGTFLRRRTLHVEDSRAGSIYVLTCLRTSVRYIITFFYCRVSSSHLARLPIVTHPPAHLSSSILKSSLAGDGHRRIPNRFTKQIRPIDSPRYLNHDPQIQTVLLRGGSRRGHRDAATRRRIRRFPPRLPVLLLDDATSHVPQPGLGQRGLPIIAGWFQGSD